MLPAELGTETPWTPLNSSAMKSDLSVKTERSTNRISILRVKTVEMLLKQLESRLCVWKVKIGFPRKQHHAVSHKLGVALFGVVMNKSCFYKTLLSGVLRFITLKGEQMLCNLKFWMKRACVSFLGFFLSQFRSNEMKKKIRFWRTLRIRKFCSSFFLSRRWRNFSSQLSHHLNHSTHAVNSRLQAKVYRFPSCDPLLLLMRFLLHIFGFPVLNK